VKPWRRVLGAALFGACCWEEWALFKMPATLLGGPLNAVAVVGAVMVVGYTGFLLMLGKNPSRPND
jgi:hypothetical protein